MTVRAYSYSRFSSAAQAAGDSERRQTSAAREYAERHGFVLDTELVDRGVSGFTGANRDKGELKRFLAMVDQGVVRPGSYLLIDSMDRLSRLPVVQATNQLLSIALAGVKVVTLNNERTFGDTADLSEMMMAVMEIERSHRESLEKGRKIAAAHGNSKRRAREEGRVWHSTGPSWLELVETTRTWKPIPERVALVNRIFEMTADLGMGATAIASRLNKEKQPTFSQNPDALWHGTTILKIVGSQSVLGHYQPRFKNGKPDGPIAIGYYGKPVVDLELFQRAQVARTQRRTSPSRGGALGTMRSLLKRRIWCAACGGTMICQRRSRDKRDLYMCYDMTRGACDNRTRYRVAELEQTIIRTIPDIDLSLTRNEQRSEEGSKLAQLKLEVVEIDAKIGRLLEQIEMGVKGPIVELYEKRLGEKSALGSEITKLQAIVDGSSLKRDPAKNQRAIKTLGALRTASGDELHDIRARLSVEIKSVVERLDFFPDKSIEITVIGNHKLILNRAVELSSEIEARMIPAERVQLHRNKDGRLGIAQFG